MKLDEFSEKKNLNLKEKLIFKTLYLNINNGEVCIVGYHYNAPHINTKQQKLMQTDSVFRKYCNIILLCNKNYSFSK